jgi:glycosyltransferase involved in cell wall biosynthesis
MRIGIDCRAASHPRRGGMKTYTENLVNALAQTDNTNRYILYYDRPYHPTGKYPSNFAQKVVKGTPRIIGAGWREQWRLPKLAHQDDLSLLHSVCNTAPFSLRAPSVVTLHDVISISDPQVNYELSPAALLLRLIGLYGRVIVPISARRASAIITVSNHEKKQIVEYLKIPPDKVHVTYLAPSAQFTPIKPGDKQVVLSKLAQEYHIEWPYLIAVGFEPRKNNEAIMRAFSILPPLIKDKLGLAIVCANEGIATKLEERGRQLGLNRFVVISSVNHDELRLIYSQATALLFPSRRESFGLPPIEAMACGTPVIAANSSCLPEILGQGAFFIDPSDIKLIAEAIEAVFTNDDLRGSLIERGFKQSKMYSWDRTARETLSVYQSLCQ